MRGQWIGSAAGANEGLILVNIDELPSHYQGVVYLNESNPALPSIAAGFKTKDKAKDFEFRTDYLLPIDPRNGLPAFWESVKHLFGQNVFVSK